MRAVATCFFSLVLMLNLTSCGNTKTAQQNPGEKSANEKLLEALTAQQAAEEQARAERRAALEAGKLASVNTICPVTGRVVDSAIAPIPIEILIVQPSEIIMVGVANEAAAEAVRRDPDRYAAAAKNNQQARAYTSVGR